MSVKAVVGIIIADVVKNSAGNSADIDLRGGADFAHDVYHTCSNGGFAGDVRGLVLL